MIVSYISNYIHNNYATNESSLFISADRLDAIFDIYRCIVVYSYNRLLVFFAQVFIAPVTIIIPIIIHLCKVEVVMFT